MATTSLIVEILVIGFTAFIWLFLFIIPIFNISPSFLLSKIFQYKEWIPFITILSAAAAYQLGTILDYFSYHIFYYGIRTSIKNKDRRFFNMGQKLKRERIPDDKFWEQYNLVCQKGSHALIEELNFDRNIIRFTRSGSINFFIIGIGILFIQEIPRKIFIFIVCMIISFFCIQSSKHKWSHWYDKIATSYSYLIKNKKCC